MGKELVARHIHVEGPRARAPFVPLNCAAFPEGLLEGEVFGHERGAFTGAVSARRGAFELAHGGTLFLDEVTEMDLSMQPKLLRVLEDGAVKRLGSERATQVDVRIVAATNRDLDREVEASRFRRDLYYRLNTVRVHIPPLRERKEDVLPLAEVFRARFETEMKKRTAGFSGPALEACLRHPWPGNARELRNAVEHAVLFAPAGEPIRTGHLPPAVAHSEAVQTFSVTEEAPIPLQELQRRYAAHVLRKVGGNRQRAAKLLGVSPVTLWRWASRGSSGGG